MANEQEGFFRPDARTSDAAIDFKVSAPPVLGPAPKLCQVTVSYSAARPDLTSLQYSSADCAAGADLALSVTLTYLLRMQFFPPAPPPKPH